MLTMNGKQYLATVFRCDSNSQGVFNDLIFRTLLDKNQMPTELFMQSCYLLRFEREQLNNNK